MTAGAWVDLPVAVVELALARRALPALDLRQWHAGGAQAANDGPWPERIGSAIRRASRVVPWRSDCLVQALAARRWLARKGIGSQVRLGARARPDGTMATHAWLVVGETVVTGGDITGFVPFTR